MRNWLRSKLLLWASVLWYVLGFMLDHLSSRHFPSGWLETNPYARDVNGAFVMLHAQAYDWSVFTILLCLGLILYLGIRRHDELIAQACFGTLFLFYGFGSYFAALHNAWIKLGWFIPDGMLH